MGRKDTQVKTRGQRVELAGVELQIQDIIFAGFSLSVDAVADLVTPKRGGQPTLVTFLKMKEVMLQKGHVDPNEQHADKQDILLFDYKSCESMWEIIADLDTALLRALPRGDI